MATINLAAAGTLLEAIDAKEDSMQEGSFVSRARWADLACSDSGIHVPLRKIVRTEVQIKDLNSETGMHDIGFVISTASVDREGDVIAVGGWELDRYKENPVVLWAHDYHTPPIGKALDVSVKDGVLVATDRFTPEDINPFGAMIYRMVKGGYLKATSVGFKPIEWTYNEDHRGYDFLRSELLEHSVVPVPANPEALVMASAAGIDLRPMREWVARFLDHDQSVEKYALVPRSVAEATWKNLSSVGAAPSAPITSGYFYRIGDAAGAGVDCVEFTTSDGTSVKTWDTTTWDPTYEVRFLGDWPKKFDDEQKRKEHEMEELLKEVLAEVKAARDDVAKLADLVQTKAPADDAPPDDDELSADELRSVVRDIVGEVLTATTGRLPA
jgi:HK97 family phage prohead protease